MKNHYLLILLICELASCIPAPNNPPISTITETPTSTPTLTPTVTQTPTSTLTLTPTVTQTPTFAITPSPTFNPYRTVINSPNGKFSARKHVFWNGISEYDKPVIEIWDQSGNILWQVPYQREWNPLNPIVGMSIYGWSPDSSKLYFYYSLHYDTGVPTFAYVRNLQFLDIALGQTEYVLPISVDTPTAFAFTPDMNKVAFISGNMVSILDLNTGLEKKVDILTTSFDDAGWIFYSPSGNRLIYHTMISGDTFAILVNPQTMEQKIVYQWTNFTISSYKFDGWSSEEYPRYIDYWETISVLDLSTLSQVSIGTITPTPE